MTCSVNTCYPALKEERNDEITVPQRPHLFVYMTGEMSACVEAEVTEAINRYFTPAWVPNGPMYFLFSSLMSCLNGVLKNYVEA